MEILINAELDELQQYFDTDLQELIDADEDELDYIEQCHFGDLLIEKVDTGGDNPQRFRLWKVIAENGEGIIIEYSGQENNYTWQTIYES